MLKLYKRKNWFFYFVLLTCKIATKAIIEKNKGPNYDGKAEKKPKQNRQNTLMFFIFTFFSVRDAIS